MKNEKNTPKFRHGVIGTLTSSTTIAGSVRITENLASMFMAEGRFELFELPEAMILKPLSEQPVIETGGETNVSDTGNNKPSRKKRNNNKSSDNDAEPTA